MWAKELSYEEGGGRSIKETTLGSPKYCSGDERAAGDKEKRRVETIKATTMDLPKYRMNQR